MKKTDPRLLQPHYNHGKENLPCCIIVDLDGTLSLMRDRSPYDGGACATDEVNLSIKSVMDRYFDDLGTEIIIFSGRNSDKGGKEATEKWLFDNHIPYDQLHMRKEGDMRADTKVKKEMFDEHIEGRYRVLFCLDDRNCMVDMYREMGLDCFQVYYGNF